MTGFTRFWIFLAIKNTWVQETFDLFLGLFCILSCQLAVADNDFFLLAALEKYLGNPLRCDKKIEWLIEYIIINRVRTHLPFQSEVLCAEPDNYRTVRLRDFLTKKANETFNAMTSALRAAAGIPSDKDLMRSFIPTSVRKFIPALERGEKNQYSDVPVIGAITKALPVLRSVPGLNYIPKATGERAEDVHSLNNAIEKVGGLPTYTVI